MSVIKRHGTARPSAAEAGKGADGGTCGDRQRTRKSSLVRKGFSIVLLSVAAGGMKYQKTAGSRPKNRHRQMTSTRRKTNHCLPFQALQAVREVFEMADDALHKISLQRRAGIPRRGRWIAPPCGRAMRGGAAPRRTTIGGPTRTRPRAGIPGLGRGARPATRGRSSLGTTWHLLDGCRTREERDVREITMSKKVEKIFGKKIF